MFRFVVSNTREQLIDAYDQYRDSDAFMRARLLGQESEETVAAWWETEKFGKTHIS
jgi:hypothetical protein